MKAGSLLLVVVASASAFAATARAQQTTSVAVFRAATGEPSLRELAEALDPVVLAELDKLTNIKVTARPALDLPATQLALDCVGETATCLRSVAEQAGAEVLIAPSLSRAADETVVTVLYFDARHDGELRTATRRHRGGDVTAAALDAVPEMLHEVFRITEQPAPEQQAQSPQLAPIDLDSEPHEPALERSLFPTVPVVITAAGVVVLGAGIGLGLMANSSEDDYAAAHTTSPQQVDAAIDEFESAKTEALLSNIAIGVGATAIAVGAVLWAVELSSEPEEPSAWVVPRLAPGEAGLMVRGRFAGAGP